MNFWSNKLYTPNPNEKPFVNTLSADTKRLLITVDMGCLKIVYLLIFKDLNYCFNRLNARVFDFISLKWCNSLI
jgi:hypothetical protein